MIGKIIVFEGLDCSFKETNAKALYEYLKEKGENVVFHSFPTYEEQSSFFVREYLKGNYGKDPSDVPPLLASQFYHIDQYHIWKTKLEKPYNEGATLILDRFWTSNLYHQLSKVGYYGFAEIFKEYDKLLSNAMNIYNLPYPDKIIFMRMSIRNIKMLLKEKNLPNDIHESKLGYVEKVYTFYNKLVDWVDKGYNVYCYDYRNEIRSKEDIFKDVLMVYNGEIDEDDFL